jgi:glyoxylase I family protein
MASETLHTLRAVHHVTLSVRNIDRSADFYSIFGFKLVLQWEAPDGPLAIAHLLRNDGFILELFQYAENSDAPIAGPDVGNDLQQLGVKHFAFRVTELEAAHNELLGKQWGRLTSIQPGRTGLKFFFIADPDGNWVEIVEDSRALSWSGEA